MIPQNDEQLQGLIAAHARLEAAQLALQEALRKWREAEVGVVDLIENGALASQFAFRLDDDRLATVTAAGGHLSVSVFNLV